MKKYLSLLALPAVALLAQVTVSGTNIALESADVTTITAWFWGVITSLFGMLTSLAPAILLMAWGFFIFRRLSKKINLKK